MRRQQSGWSVSRLASRQRVAILSDIIINKKLKLLQINYLAQKVDVLFNFLLGNLELETCNRTYGKTRYVQASAEHTKNTASLRGITLNGT